MTKYVNNTLTSTEKKVMKDFINEVKFWAEKGEYKSWKDLYVHGKLDIYNALENILSQDWSNWGYESFHFYSVFNKLVIQKYPNLFKTLRFVPQEFFFDSDVEIVDIPREVVSLGLGAFGSCHSLKEIHYEGTMKEWDELVEDSTLDITGPDYVIIKCSDGESTW